MFRLTYSNALVAFMQAKGWARPNTPGILDHRKRYGRLILPEPRTPLAVAKMKVAKELARQGIITMEDFDAG